MKKNKKNINKFLLGGVSAALVAGAVIPVASADVGGTITKDIGGTVTKDKLVSPFTDVSDNHAHLEGIVYAYENGFINGYGDGTFKPSESIKRIHTALIIARALGADPEGDYKDAGFKDVPKEYKWAVNFLYEEGIINGKTATNFGSNDTTTRGQMAKIIANAYKLEASKDSENPFNDVPKPYEKFVQALFDNGITTGTSDTKYSPNANVTRGQFATFITRAELNVDKGEEEEEVVVIPLEVKDVKVVNSKEFTIEFNEAVTSESALDVKNYTFKVGANEVSKFKVELVDDKKVLVTLTEENKIVNGGALSLKVSDKVLSKEFKEGIKDGFTKTIVFEDTTGPVLKSVSKVGDDIVVNFDEYVTTADAIKIDGVNVTVPTAEKETTKTLVLKNAGKNLTEGKHGIVLSGVSDNIGNKSGVLFTDFVVGKDLSSPSISKVEQKGDYDLVVTFNKAVKFVSGNKIKIYKNGFELNAVVNTTDNINYSVTLVDNGTLKVYGDKEDTSVVNVVADGFKAVANDEIGTKVEKTIVLSKDKIAPVLDTSKNSIVNIGTPDSAGVTTINEVLKVEFNENVNLFGTANDLIVTDKDGIKQTVSGVHLITDTEGGKKVIHIDVPTIKDANGKIKEGIYTVDIPSKFVTDIAGNANVSTKTTFAVSSKDSTTTVVASGVNNVITLAYSEEMDTSALNPLNYTVDGKALGADSKIYFNNDKKTVVIELPANFIKYTGGAIVNISENVKTTFGKSISKNSLIQYIASGLVDNTSPTVVSAVKKSNNTIEVTLSEAINDATIADKAADNDFIVRVNGTKFEYTVSTGNNVNDNVLVITTNDTFNFGNVVTVEVTDVVSDISITDLSSLANKLVKTDVITTQ